MIKRIQDIRDDLKYQLAWAQAVQKDYADRHRIPAPEIRVGDQVMLDARNVTTNRPSNKLDYKNLGRFTVTEVAKNGSAIKLDLPDSYKIFPWFHPSLIHLTTRPFPGQEITPPEPIEVYDDDSAEYEATEILDSRVDRRRKDPLSGKKGCLQYQIKYRGYDDKPDWQIWTDALGSYKLVQDFHDRFPNKPGPHPTFKNSHEWEDEVKELLARVVLYALLDAAPATTSQNHDS
jgi:hypothetical protein